MEKSFLCAILLFNLYAIDDFYEKSKEGWFFYKDEPKKKNDTEILEHFTEPIKKDRKQNETEFMRSIPINNLSSLTTEEFRQTFQKAKDIAVMQPTEENVLILQIMNSFMTDKSQEFTNMWQSNLLNHTEKVVGEQIAMSAFEKKFMTEDDKENDRKAFDKLLQDGFRYIVFFKENDRKLAEIKRLVIEYIDKRIPIHFIDINNNENLIKKYKMTTFPEIFAVTDKKEPKHISAGITNSENIIHSTKIQYKEYFTKKLKKGKK